MYNLKDKAIVLGVSGSIAIHKVVDLASKLTQAGAQVDVVMTPDAMEFIRPVTFQSITGRRVYGDMWSDAAETQEPHVALARRADVLAVAPATATVMARMALGLAEEMVSLTALATVAPIVVCPAMDPQMWAHTATQANVATLRSRGAHFVGPEEGRLASGQMGLGRLSEVEKIMGGIRQVLGLQGDLAGKKIAVSAGPTQEPIDPVRYIGNRSSGKMGFAIAEAARDRGAKVTLVTGPTALSEPYGVEVMHVARAQEMRDAIVAATENADVLVMSAAVADYQVGEPVGEKIKRGEREGLDLHLVRTPDILAEVGTRVGLIKVGFAAESHEVVKHARDKVAAKGLDLIVANDITEPGSGFGTDTNRIVIVDRDGHEEALPQLPKYEVAWRILDRVAALLGRNAG